MPDSLASFSDDTSRSTASAWAAFLESPAVLDASDDESSVESEPVDESDESDELDESDESVESLPSAVSAVLSSWLT